MLQTILSIALSPLLLAQGLYVRRTAVRLPEAAGLREGVAGQGEPLALMILGDSAAAGVGAESQHEALSGQLAIRLSGRFRLSWRLWAETGRTSRDILAVLQRAPAQPIDVVLTSVGVNDVTSGMRLAAWLEQQAGIVGLLKSKFDARRIIVSALPPMQHFSALPQPLRWVLGRRAARFNAALADALRDDPVCRMLPIEFPFEPAFLASDGFHPSAAAYALWAEQAAALMLEPAA